MHEVDRFLLVYGSQTGQSEAVAEQILSVSEQQGLKAVLLCGEDVQPSDLHDQVVVFVVSSTGDGDPPDNFDSFWLALHDTPPKNLTFALLGLGDSNYTSFGGFPCDFHDFLTKNGAKSFYDFQIADDQVGLELVVEPWISGLWDPLKAALNKGSLIESLISKVCEMNVSEQVTSPIFALSWDDSPFLNQFPYGVKDLVMPFSVGRLEEAIVLSKRQLTDQLDLVKEVIEIELSTSDVAYSAGDSLGLLCENSESEVMKLLDILQLASDSKYTLTPNQGVKARLIPKHTLSPCSPYYALKYTLDIHSAPKKALLRYLAECCEKKEEARCLHFLASKEGSEDLNKLIYSQSLTLLEILSLFPSCHPSFSFLLQFLPRLTPRYYSLSRTKQGVSVTFAFSHVNNTRQSSELPQVPGVCTSFLKSLKVGDTVHMYRRKNDSFKPNTEGSGGLIMIGAGTGVSPYLGFLDQMAGLSTKVPTLLITGNRYQALDSIYSKEFEDHVKEGVLTHYRPVFSREPDSQCRYVQDILTRDSQEVMSWIGNKARVYVCGDAKGLGAAVFETFKHLLCVSKNITDEMSSKILLEMKKDNFYCEDIWS